MVGVTEVPNIYNRVLEPNDRNYKYMVISRLMEFTSDKK